jgi:3-oxo-5-alpha-steroid 4-dehydrogenase 3
MFVHTGHVVTTGYKVPKGGWFDLVSHPHYLGEMLVYTSLLLASGNYTSTLTWLTASVIVSQVARAKASQRWYVNNVKDYPADRSAIIPHVL